MRPSNHNGEIFSQIAQCRLCETRFSQGVSGHEPRPVVWAAPEAKILIAGQAPGLRVHHSGRPFDDRSGRRLRQWMGLSDAEFYDQNLCAILPMAFCFPGYNSEADCNNNSASAAISKWIKTVAGPDAVIHGLRHGFRDRLRVVEASVDMIDQLGGWSLRTVGQGYGDGYLLELLYRWMSNTVETQ